MRVGKEKMNEQSKRCQVCSYEKPINMFNERRDGTGRKHICRICEMRKRAEAKAKGYRECHDCGRLTINYRCASCWQALCGFNPLKVKVDATVNEINI